MKCQKTHHQIKYNLIQPLKKVRMKGLEPPRLSAPDPKSGAATNYATSAKNKFLYFFLKRLQIYNLFLHETLLFN